MTCCGKQLAAEVDWCREESAEERLLEQLSCIAAAAFDEAALPASGHEASTAAAVGYWLAATLVSTVGAGEAVKRARSEQECRFSSSEDGSFLEEFCCCSYSLYLLWLEEETAPEVATASWPPLLEPSIGLSLSA